MVSANNGIEAFSDAELLAGYDKLISIRDDFIGKKLSAIGQGNQSANQNKAQSTHQPPPAVTLSSFQPSNGKTNLAHVVDVATTSLSDPHVPKGQNAAQSRSPSAHKLQVQQPGASGIDPIFLTKSPVLVRAEIHQKRQRLEKALEEQVYKSQKQKTIDNQDALPDFDVSEILQRAQELVKPIQTLPDNNRTNGLASSNDSFDEKTFYSSQMDESTTTDDADESNKGRTHQICKYYLEGKPCRFGEACIFSHDPELKRKLKGEASQVVGVDRSNADEQASLGQTAAPTALPQNNNVHLHSANRENLVDQSALRSQAEHDRQERIAKLEAELRSMRAEQEAIPQSYSRQQEKEGSENQEDRAYSPPEPDEFGRDVGRRQVETRRRRPSADVQPRVRDHDKRSRHSASPLSNNVRVVTNHIKSPVAPQPSRVSPLATAKVPQVSQIQREDGENRRLSRASNAGNSSARQSPKMPQQPRNSRKRRRGRDLGEERRNVVPRTDHPSPVVQVKEEPVSPPPFTVADSELRQPRVRQQAPGHVYEDGAIRHYPEEESLFYRPRPGEQPYEPSNNDQEPRTPLVRRVISRNGQRYITNDEPDLRRVVTAPRYSRVPMSPPPYPAQYSAPQPRAPRAASHVYTSSTSRPSSYSLRPLAQDHGAAYVTNDRSPSPPFRRVPQSPTVRNVTAMGPPPRRIVIDQWGNRYMEAPLPAERPLSVAPTARPSDGGHRYEQVIPRGVSVSRQPKYTNVDDESHYAPGAPSPTSNGLYGMPTGAVTEPRGDFYENGLHQVQNHGPSSIGYASARPVTRYEEVPEMDARIIRMRSVQPQEERYEEAISPNERSMRMHSVRAPGELFQAPREEVMRVQSVRPEQPRIIKLGERQESGRQVNRQVSIHPDDREFRRADYSTGESRYQYLPQAQDGGFVEEIQNNPNHTNTFYDAPTAGGRRVLQRM
ncbi:hypothetical protein ACLMJK_001869 [Lecanora helva]